MNSWEYNSKYVRLTETNPFSCQHCGKRYRWKSTLKRHESFECGGKEPAHKCPHCDYRAKQSGNLRVHIRKYHNERNSLGGSVGSVATVLPVVNDMLPATSDKASLETDKRSVQLKETKEPRKADIVEPSLSSMAEDDVSIREEESFGDQQSLLSHSAACYSDSADSDQSKNYSKKRFSPFQVETLKRVFAQSPYITQSQAAALARRTGLKKLQVRKWFSDYRCKIKKQSVLLERFSSAHAAATAAAAAAMAASSSRTSSADAVATVSLLDDEDPGQEPDDGNEAAAEEAEQEDDDVQEEEEDAGDEEDEGDDEEEEEVGEAASEEGDADDDTDVDMNAEIDQMIAARSVRPITIVFGKRSRKRAKKREKERSLGSSDSGPGKRGRKKKKMDVGSDDDGGGNCSVAADDDQSQSQTVKRFSPYQVEMLKKAYADSPYITQRQAAVLARNIGLKKMQVRKWFCDHRCKIKKQSLRLQAEGFGSVEACDRKAAAALGAPAQIPSTRKSLLERLTGGDHSRGGDAKGDDDDENVDFTDSDDPHAANGMLDDDQKGSGHTIPKSRISLPRRTFRFNEKQLKVLNEEFDKSQFLNEDTLTYLCDKLQERRERIQTWFKMRRYKLRQSEQRFWKNIIDSS